MDIISELAPYPKIYSSLLNKFDDLHPILIGSPLLCEKLYKVIKKKDEITAFQTINAQHQEHDLGLIQIPVAMIENLPIKKLVQPYIAFKNLSTHYSSEILELGEFKIGRSQIIAFTAKRWKYLTENGMIAKLPDDLAPYHVILPKYCLMLGIESEDMIVKILSNNVAQILKQEVDNYFEQLSVKMSLNQKIFLAHEQAWKNIGGLEYFDFVKKMFYKNIK
ncbi:hypothetical protein [Chroococcus sp. FPU101]|uniref:hypothetical protein n=1 Tax=Chroococcus sp. FPU101 TaxID=1974212 RepID=UPI001A90C944|nr:hypothetical protein [Chroococcus sp. FPU101]GFE68142.1 hypothetical protein CFPU101_07520 [Chroococcus sp. FPU101]